MAINIIAYSPGGGGNHIKNLCDLSARFHDQWPWSWVREQSLGLSVYDDPPGVPGEVHSLPGRNLHEVFIQHVTDYPHRNYLLHGHFGELAVFADAIRDWPDVRWLIQTLEHQQDRALLRARQQRLQYHPYWLDEEQIFLYHASMYQRYFGARPEHCQQLPLRLVWQPDLVKSTVISRLQTAFDICIDPVQAQSLHHKWLSLNGLDQQSTTHK